MEEKRAMVNFKKTQRVVASGVYDATSAESFLSSPEIGTLVREKKKKKRKNSQSYQFDDLSAEFILLINSFTVPHCYVIPDIFPPSFSV